MRTIEIIVRQVTSLDPALRSEALLAAVPQARVRKLKNGCDVEISVRDPDPGVVPDIVLRFDASTRVVGGCWAQLFPDINGAADMFEVMERLIRKHMLVRPARYATPGNRKVRSNMGQTWRISEHQSLTLQMTQPRVRVLSREVSLVHSLRQVDSTVASTPALWGGHPG